MSDKDLYDFDPDFSPIEGDIPIEWARAATGLSPADFAAVVDAFVRRGAIELFLDNSGCKWVRPTDSGLTLFSGSS